MKKHIPNLLTLLNLASGTIGIYLVIGGNPKMALYFLFAAFIFDFADGFFARLLKAGSEIGKQLDSLADIVSFGLFSAAMIFSIIKIVLLPSGDQEISNLSFMEKLLLGSVAIVPVFAAIRLAKFNLQEDTSFFLGLPVPAFALFWAGIYYDMNFNQGFFGKELNLWFSLAVMLVTSILMIVPLPMLSFKFSNLKLRENSARYLLILASIVIISLTGIPGLPIVILTYILLSLVRILIT